MPTVILVDCSLSMIRPIVADDPSSESRRLLTERGVNSFLDTLKGLSPLEHVALLAFSSTCNVVVPFTRDLDSVRAGLLTLETGDKTLPQRAIRGAGEHLLAEFGPYAPCHVVMVTDGCPGANADVKGQETLGPVPFPLPGSIHIVLASHPDDVSDANERFYRRVCSQHTSNPGDVIIPNDLSQSSVNSCLSQLAERLYNPFNCRIDCGRLSAEVSLVPRPFFLPLEWAVRHTASCGGGHMAPPAEITADSKALQLPSTLTVCGFLEQSSIAGPPVIARHLVLDSSTAMQNQLRKDMRARTTSVTKAEATDVDAGSGTPTSAAAAGTALSRNGKDTSQPPALQIENNDAGGGVAATASTTAIHGTAAGGGSGADDGHAPSFRVLLHAGLRVESYVALVKFRDDWFGFLLSGADSKKKANLMLSVLAPGCEIPWLGGKLSNLGPSALLQQEAGLTRKRKHSESSEQAEPELTEYCPSDYLPVPPLTPPSFNSQSGLTWAKQLNLQNDVQKVIRFAKRLPDKLNGFLREVNRIRQTALCYGINQLLEVLSSLLLREQAHYAADSVAPRQLAAVSSALLTQRDPDVPFTAQMVESMQMQQR